MLAIGSGMTYAEFKNPDRYGRSRQGDVFSIKVFSAVHSVTKKKA